MTRNLLLILTCILFTHIAHAQSEIFISEYVEGSSNNKAIELYNPTDRVIDLSEYSVGRFRNGSNQFTGGQIPSGNFLDPHETFVIVLDKRDSLGVEFETAVWNGYVLMEPVIDTLTGEIRLAVDGDTLLRAVYDLELGRYLFGTYYREKFDLQAKADIFVNPVYQQNTSFFYYNGDDAVALVKGATVNSDGSNILDVVGVIGEDPEVVYGTPYWTDGQGRRMTDESTLVRAPEISEGTGVVVAALQDTFPYSEWQWNFSNTFVNLGEHLCFCNPNNNDELDLESGLRVFPNPGNSEGINLEADWPISQINIYNQVGIPISFEKTIISNSSYLIKGLMSGQYFISVRSKNNDRVVFKQIIE